MNARSTPDLKQSIKNLNALPAMPVIAQKLLALQLDTDEGEQAEQAKHFASAFS